MGTYGLVFQGRTDVFGALHVTGDEFFDRIATERPAADARKHARTLRRQILTPPRLEHGGRVAAERRAALCPPFPFAPDVCATAHDDVLAPETDQFRHAQTGLNRDGQKGVVAAADPRRPIGRGEDGVISAPSRNAMGLRWSRWLGIARTCGHSRACAGSASATDRKNE